MIWLVIGIIAILALFGLYGCQGKDSNKGAGITADKGATQTLKNISAQESNDPIQLRKADPNFIILDIRTPQEFADGHIEGAINLDFYASNFKERLNTLDKSKTYMMYCRSGNRSGKALGMMKDQNFTEVYNMTGGIGSWAQKGLPVVK
ncbi:Rhodanese domain protein [Candidatus Moduliflexus flocculans]|uniref:Rhodanese domain protein n=1 Tax=Candidatus Moduliflexus flocculans TaxID=1499966 RepID=A0A0S6VQU9_9BACT|nr:Rhodanese domain protein [Candidatus Moduliflexus flocculans]